MDSFDLAEAIARLDATLSVTQVLSLAKGLSGYFAAVPDLTTHDGRVAFARTQPQVVSYIQQNRKIKAIKELREALSNANAPYGLYECKEAVDALTKELDVCPHGLSLTLCHHPEMHYPPDNHHEEPPF